jgi:hypothetical protein
MESRTPSSFREVISNLSLLDRIGRIEPYDAPVASTSQAQNRGGDPELVSRWARSMANDPPREQSRRSLSPAHRSTRSSGRPTRSLSPLPRTETSVRRSRSGSSTRTMETDVGGGFYGEFREIERAADMEEDEPEQREGSNGSPGVPRAETTSVRGSPIGVVPSPIHTWEPGFQTREEAAAAIANWAPSITDEEPSIGPYENL